LHKVIIFFDFSFCDSNLNSTILKKCTVVLYDEFDFNNIPNDTFYCRFIYYPDKKLYLKLTHDLLKNIWNIEQSDLIVDDEIVSNKLDEKGLTSDESNEIFTQYTNSSFNEDICSKSVDFNEIDELLTSQSNEFSKLEIKNNSLSTPKSEDFESSKEEIKSFEISISKSNDILKLEEIKNTELSTPKSDDLNHESSKEEIKSFEISNPISNEFNENSFIFCKMKENEIMELSNPSNEKSNENNINDSIIIENENEIKYRKPFYSNINDVQNKNINKKFFEMEIEVPKFEKEETTEVSKVQKPEEIINQNVKTSLKLKHKHTNELSMDIMSIEVNGIQYHITQVKTRHKLKPNFNYDPIITIYYQFSNLSDINIKGSLMIKSESNTNILIGENIEFCDDEKKLIERFIGIVLFYDPDILVGYEVQKTSIGYLIERTFVLSILSIIIKSG
jgi:hypothetical protein